MLYRLYLPIALNFVHQSAVALRPQSVNEEEGLRIVGFGMVRTPLCPPMLNALPSRAAHTCCPRLRSLSPVGLSSLDLGAPAHAFFRLWVSR